MQDQIWLTSKPRLHDKPSGRWLITGQKVWTSLAHESDFCFVLARTNPDSSLHKGLDFPVKLHQPGIEIRPIRQMTATSEFNEIFFRAVCSENDVVISPEEGWKVAMGLLGLSEESLHWVSKCYSKMSLTRL